MPGAGPAIRSWKRCCGPRWNCIWNISTTVSIPNDTGLYESYANTWPTDDQWYNGGGTAEETAYAYTGHKAALEMARRAGDEAAVQAARGAAGENPQELHGEALDPVQGLRRRVCRTGRARPRARGLLAVRDLLPD